MLARECSRTACSKPAVSSLTFVYADSTAVLGPLSKHSEPHAYDLCRDHSTRMTAPRGWDLLRVPGSGEATDDLVALSDAVHQRPDLLETPGRPETRDRPETEPPAPSGPSPRTTREPRRSAEREPSTSRHLHVVRSTDD